AGDARDGARGHPRLPKEPRGAACREDLDAERGEPAGQVDHTGLVMYAQQGSTDASHGYSVRRRGAFAPDGRRVNPLGPDLHAPARNLKAPLGEQPDRRGAGAMLYLDV